MFIPSYCLPSSSCLFSHSSLPSLYLRMCACAHPCMQCAHCCGRVRVGVLVRVGGGGCGLTHTLSFHCPGLFLFPNPTSMPLTINAFRGPSPFPPHSLFRSGLLGQEPVGKNMRCTSVHSGDLGLLLPLPCTPGDRGPEITVLG